MTTQLSERLRDLADDAPDPLSAAGLWSRGRRRHRRRVGTAVAVVAAVVVLTAGAGYGNHRSRQPAPAAPPATQSGSMTVPDRFYEASPWLPSTRSPGRLVAVFSRTRDHFPFGSTGDATVGVTAGSQAYRFLELPGQSQDSPEVALAPDGRHVAYWITGTPSHGAPSLPGAPDTIVGIATLDVATGAVERHDLRSPYGLSVQSITWADDSTVAVFAPAFSSADADSYTGYPRAQLVGVGSGEIRQLALTDPVDRTVAMRGGIGTFAGTRVVQLTDLSGSAIEKVRASAPIGQASIDDHGRRLAGVLGHLGTAFGTLAWGRVHAGRVALSRVPGRARYVDVLAWVDATHVVAERESDSGTFYDVVNLRTGSHRALTRSSGYGLSLAADALHEASPVAAVAPPTPWNWRLITVWGLIALLLGSFFGYVAHTLWRQRVRR